MKRIDLNCDMGESFGPWPMGNDAEVMPWISSANIACGYHAGDASIMLVTARRAHEAGVAIGAHVGLPDLAGFGRRRMAVSPNELYAMSLAQTGAMQAMATSVGGRLHHVKPHGALYHMLEEDAALAEAHVAAVRDIDAALWIYGFAGGRLVASAQRAGLHAAGEGFVDRAYQGDGSLVPRSEPGAVLDDPEAIATQAVALAVEGRVMAGGSAVAVDAATLCLHGDRDNAGAVAQAVHHVLCNANIRIIAPSGMP